MVWRPEELGTHYTDLRPQYPELAPYASGSHEIDPPRFEAVEHIDQAGHVHTSGGQELGMGAGQRANLERLLGEAGREAEQRVIKVFSMSGNMGHDPMGRR